ncbi:MAG: UMP kinase [Eubacteriales bacterium]|nr:UMP kinase [Eubacteriales bacterium]
MKRVMLKLSGEALGKDGWLFDFSKIDAVAKVLTEVQKKGFELAVVIGGGNIWRGRKGASQNMNPVTADSMGMLSTVLNCLCAKDAIIRAGGKAKVFSAIDMPSLCDGFRADKADEALKEGFVTLFAGGLGSPFFTTDTAVVLRCLEINADMLLLAKNIDGVYTADPNSDPDAKLIKSLSYEDAVEQDLRVMDASAFHMLRDKKFPLVRVFSLDKAENILKVLDGDDMGTVLFPKS